jgi:hypothetical protein
MPRNTGRGSMKMDLPLPFAIVDVSPPDSAEYCVSSEISVDAEESIRSRRNIAEWRSYLPKDCVDRMIEMGWDLST